MPNKVNKVSPAFAVPATRSDATSLLHRFDHFAMACAWELFIPAQEAECSPEYAQQVAWAVWDEVDRLERELSRYLPGSDVSQINAAAPGQKVTVGIAVLECLRLAADVHQATQGAFDVTIGNLLDLRRGADGSIGAPSANEPPGVIQGMKLLEVDEKNHTIGWKEAGAKIDLGGIGKGYALDAAANVLREWSIGAALLHSGQSTVSAIGAPPGEEWWRLALRDPRDHERALGTMRLRDCALSGSGTLLHGRHIVDPRTGRAADDKLATWAVAASAALSDAISTALMVMSIDEIEEYGPHHPEISGLLMIGDPVALEMLFWGEFEKMETNAS